MKIILLALFAIGCTQVKTLSMQRHQFAMQPKKIVWIQVPGLDEEHLAFYKFSPNPQGNYAQMSWENFVCLGKMWNDNLFDIRPTAVSSMGAQVTGSRNLKNSCEDFSHKPIWNPLSIGGHEVGIFEGRSSLSMSLTRQDCPQMTDYLLGATIWKMDKARQIEDLTFHQSEKIPFERNKIYYDLSCQSNSCYSSLSANVISVFERFSKNKENYFFLIRNFDLNDGLDSKDIPKVKDAIAEMDRLTKYFQEKFEGRYDALILVTGAAAKRVEFPTSGPEWVKYETKKGEGMLYKKQALLSPVFARGARAENFCGMYDEADLSRRILTVPQSKGFELEIFNLFR